MGTEIMDDMSFSFFYAESEVKKYHHPFIIKIH